MDDLEEDTWQYKILTWFLDASRFLLGAIVGALAPITVQYLSKHLGL
jgi:hypothetical protein